MARGDNTAVGAELITTLSNIHHLLFVAVLYDCIIVVVVLISVSVSVHAAAVKGPQE